MISSNSVSSHHSKQQTSQSQVSTTPSDTPFSKSDKSSSIRFFSIGTTDTTPETKSLSSASGISLHNFGIHTNNTPLIEYEAQQTSSYCPKEICLNVISQLDPDSFYNFSPASKEVLGVHIQEIAQHLKQCLNVTHHSLIEPFIQLLLPKIQKLFPSYSEFISFLKQCTENQNHLVSFLNQNKLLINAVENPNIELVKLLLDLGCDPNTVDHSQNTPLHTAVYNNNPDIIKLLLKHPNINLTIKNRYTHTPFLAAFERMPECNYVIVQSFLAHPQIKVNEEDPYEFPCLSVVCIDGHVETLKILFEKDVNLDRVDCFQSTALDYAIEHKHFDTILPLLLEQFVIKKIKFNEPRCFENIINDTTITSDQKIKLVTAFISCPSITVNAKVFCDWILVSQKTGTDTATLINLIQIYLKNPNTIISQLYEEYPILWLEAIKNDPLPPPIKPSFIPGKVLTYGN